MLRGDHKAGGLPNVISLRRNPSALARTIRYLDFDTLVLINKEVVSLTRETHGYDEDDETRLKALLRSVKELDADKRRKDVITEKAALLVFKIASGQNFHEGNKRTALVAGLAFLRMNGSTLDIKDAELVSVVDRAGVATATLKDVKDVLERLVKHVG
jgi:death-on-curing family protein